MGDAGVPREKILLIIPFPEPKDLEERIRKKHPNVEFAYKALQFYPKVKTDAIPDGRCSFPPP
jgi:hypothetical protein